MWIFWTLAAFAVLGYLGYVWMSALVTKYSHTKESVLILAALACAALALGAGAADQVAPEWSAGPKAAITIGVGFTLFTLFSFLAVNMWCALLTRGFDEKIALLEEEEYDILRRLDLARWEAIRKIDHPQAEIGAAAPELPADEYSTLKHTLEAWEEGGGAARIRSVKVAEWRDAVSGMSQGALADELGSLELENRDEPDEAKKEQAKAHWALIKMEMLERGRKASAPPKDASRQEPSKLPEDEVTLRGRLQAIQVEISSQRKLKQEFMRSRVRLAWRLTK